MLGLVTAEVAAALDPDLLPLDELLRDQLGDDRVRIVAWDDAGIPITPTIFVAPGEPAPSVAGVHVVKPTVGAGSGGARRCEPDEVAAHVAVLHGEGRTAMVQPYLDRLDELGETAHCFVARPATSTADAQGAGVELQLSHAFRKGAILTSTEVDQTGNLFATEQIDAREPADAELDLARRVLATETVRSLGPIMFARVDIAPCRDADGNDSHVLMELELIEPSFYFEVNPSSAAVFADALIGWLDRHDSAERLDSPDGASSD